MSVDKVISVTKDVVLFGVGIGGIAYQQITGSVNVSLLVVFAAMTGVPGLTHLISLARGPGTESQSSRSASPSAGSDSTTRPS